MYGELPHADAVRLPVSSTRLDPPERGYGGLGVRRREFPTHRRYKYFLTNKGFKLSAIHRQAKTLALSCLIFCETIFPFYTATIFHLINWFWRCF